LDRGVGGQQRITELPQLNRNTLDLTAVTPAIQGQGPKSNDIGTLGPNAYLIANNGNSYSVAGGQVNGTIIAGLRVMGIVKNFVKVKIKSKA